MVSPQGDPILASRQYGLGKTVAFTSGASTRWASKWLEWPGFDQFWEQVIRWAMRPSQSPNMQVLTDLEGQQATVYVEATGQDAADFANFLDISGVVIDPVMGTAPIKLQQVGPGRYKGNFRATMGGTYVVNMQHSDGKKTGLVQGALTVSFAPEFRNLKDNAALLGEVATISGGRMLSGRPEADKLFDHASLVFPSVARPLWKPLLVLWLVLFLIDVAVRRVVVDFSAVLRQIRQAIGALSRGQSARQAIAALREHQLSVRKKIKRDADSRLASARFEPSTQVTRPTELFTAQQEDQQPAKSKPQKEQKIPEKPSDAESYMDRLKQAKQKARDDMETNDGESKSL